MLVIYENLIHRHYFILLYLLNFNQVFKMILDIEKLVNNQQTIKKDLELINPQ